ncbi:MAG: sterol desaturase family protein [Chitinophagales bacterium]|nr:sterol desaturase family protein [Chitinophagales bacterium]HRG34908.1 sterol desaturase family protein [Chitinophagales bacterium]
MEHLSTVIAIPIFLIFIIIEFFATRKKHPEYYRLNDTITNLNIGVSHLLFKLLTTGLLLSAYVFVMEKFAVLHLHGITAYIVVLILFDFCFYWAHRFGHEINLFWGAHVVHHQSEEYNLSVALRQSWIHSFLAFIFFLPIAFLGVDVLTLGICASINSFYQFWIHTKAVHRMPEWFEYIFNTPSHHRVHHGVNPKYIDKNHGGMFIIWDRLFGTFQAEEEAPTYGITTPLKSWNPAWANIEYYVMLVKKAKPYSFADKLKLIFAKPGWQPNAFGGQLVIPAVDKSTPKYDANASSKNLNLYVLAQFVCIIIGLSAYLLYYEHLSIFYKIVFFSILMLSTVICSAILEQKNWVKYVEYIRLSIAAIALNTMYYINHNGWFYIVFIISCVLTAYFLTWFTLNINKRFIFKIK